MKKSVLLIVSVILAIFITTACTTKKEDKYDYLVLVNKYSKLPDDWEKNVELVNAKNAWDEDVKVEKEAYEQYKKLADDLKKEDITIELDSIYRSVKEQQELWDNWSKDPEKGIEYVKKYVATPGYSEHHTGLAIDICLKKDGKLIDDNDDMIAENEIFEKIHAKLADYGFILRYLDGRDDVTGYAYEPWHLRYIGNKEIAKEIMDKNITLEEYLGKEKDIANNKSAAKYQIERKLIEEFEDNIYKDKISNERFNVTNIYNQEEANKDETLKSLKLGKDDIAFVVSYELMPTEDANKDEIMIPDGEYDEETGWIKDMQRVGILRYNSKNGTLKLENFGTGW